MPGIWALGKIRPTEVRLKGSDRVIGTTETHDIRDILVDTLFKDIYASGSRHPKVENAFRELFGRAIDGAQIDTPGSRPRDVFEELKSHNSDQLSELKAAQEADNQATRDYTTRALDELKQLNAGFAKQMQDMRTAQEAEMATLKQQNEATLSGLNKSFQSQLAIRDKQEAIRAQQSNMDLIREKSRSRSRDGLGLSATLLSNPMSSNALMLGNNRLLGL